MISRSIIRSYTNTAAYNKGLDLYRANKTEQFSVEEDATCQIVDATVKGSGRKIYHVALRYDKEEDNLKDCFCECPAFYKYNGICKHCVAVLLEFIDWDKRQGTILAELKRREQSLNRLQSMRGALKTKQKGTTPAFRQMLLQQQKKTWQTIVQEGMLGQVHLEPAVVCGSNGQVYAEFKIGTSHMYVLKDVFSFLNAIENGEHVSYGQKLEFVHGMDMFDEESRSWILFFRSWFLGHMKYILDNSYTMPKLRRLELMPGELDDFMERLGDREFAGTIDGESRTFRRTDEPLTRELRITGTSQGIEIRLSQVFGVKGGRFSYYFLDGKVYRVSIEQMAPIQDFLNCMVQIPDRQVFVQKEDVPMFCRELLPLLKERFHCVTEQFDAADYGLVPVEFAFYLDAPARDLVTCRPVARYGEQEYPVFGEKEHKEQRDLRKEAEIVRLVSGLTSAYDERQRAMAVVDDDEIYEFLTRGIERLQQAGEVMISDALKRIRVNASPRMKVGISVAGDVMELQITSEDMSREQLLEILSKYSRRKKFYRLKSGEFINLEDEELGTFADLKQGLSLTDAQLRQKTVTVPKYRALFLDSELREHAGIAVSRDRAFRSLVRNMKTVEDNDFELPAQLEPVLRGYQKRGFLWLKTLKHNGFGGILADDMGLGKTLQVIAFLQSEILGEGQQGNRRCLIVTPASLVFNWENEFQRFAPDLKVRMIVGTAAKRRELIEEAEEDAILLTSYDLLKRDIDSYEKVSFMCQVIDEAQFIKNHGTQASRAVRQIRAGFKLALTGTPVENRLSELWSIFDYLMPGFLYSYQKFREVLEAPIVQNQDEAAMRQLQKMIRPFVLRRLKQDVLTDLPAKIERNFFAKMEGEQQKLYDAHVKRLRILLDKQSEEEFKTSKIQLLAELTKLRQLCCDPSLIFEDYHGEAAKLETCMELVRGAVEGGHKILLFSQFTSMLERICRRLEAEDISFYTLTGSTGKEQRIRLVEAFNQDDTSVFCISLKAGGTGLNLTAADMVIHFDPWWNLAVQNQATDRAHRIGQKQVVTVYKLLTKGTIEENIVRLQEKKRELAEEILSGDGMKSGSFSREEIMELLNRE